MSKVVSIRTENKNSPKVERFLGVKDFYQKRNKVLIIRAVGGLGDILMHRMMFESFKELIGDGEVHFACPTAYHQAVEDHPYLSQVLDSTTVDKNQYVVSYNTTTACGRYEMRVAPLADKHRSDIWSEHCGVNLKKHDMHICLKDREVEEGLDILDSYRNRPGPVVLVVPISAMIGKNLLDHQLIGIFRYLEERGCCPMGLHTYPIMPLIKKNMPSIHSLSIRQWMSAINAADYIVSVDTAALHCAGGMMKPTTGIFTFVDGYVYSKYYPTVEIVQKHRDTNKDWTCGPCYNWGECPKSKLNPKPCLTEITIDELIAGMEKMFEKYPMR